MLKLTSYEQDMLDGKYGRFKQIALENVVKYAKVVGAEELVPVTKSTLYFGAHSYLETCDAETYDEIFAKMYLCTDEKVKLGKFAETCYCQTCVAPCDQYDYEFNHLSKELFDRNTEYLKRTLEEARGNKELRAEYTITQEMYEESYRQICSAGSGPVDYVVLGCPHYSLEDIQQAALYLKGKKIASGVEFSIWTDMSSWEMAKASGFLDIIEEAGGRLMSSSCPLVMDPVAFAHVNALVTDAGKQAHYMHSSMDPDKHVPIYYGSVEKCIDAAVAGYWKED